MEGENRPGEESEHLVNKHRDKGEKGPTGNPRELEKKLMRDEDAQQLVDEETRKGQGQDIAELLDIVDAETSSSQGHKLAQRRQEQLQE